MAQRVSLCWRWGSDDQKIQDCRPNRGVLRLAVLCRELDSELATDLTRYEDRLPTRAGPYGNDITVDIECDRGPEPGWSMSMVKVPDSWDDA